MERVGIVPARIEEMENFSTLYTRLGMGHGFGLLSEEANHMFRLSEAFIRMEEKKEEAEACFPPCQPWICTA